MNDELSFLGQGWGFPPTFDKNTKQVLMVSELEDIRQSLKILLSTSLGERIMQPNFGCNLSDFVFAEIDRRLINDIKDEVSEAIIEHEPRIDLETVDVFEAADKRGLLLINISYVVRNSNTYDNLIYPFYLNEETT